MLSGCRQYTIQRLLEQPTRFYTLDGARSKTTFDAA